MTYTENVEQIANQHGINTSVAMDVEYLIALVNQIIEIAKNNPDVIDFDVYHPVLESQLETYR